MGNIKSFIKLDNIVAIIPLIFALYLGCTYVSGFIVSQVSFIKDFGVLPFQQVHYLYYGFLPVLIISIILLTLVSGLVNLKHKNRLKKPANWVGFVLMALIACLLAVDIKLDLKNMFLDLSIIFCLITLVFYQIYALFYSYTDFNDVNIEIDWVSIFNDLEEAIKLEKQLYISMLDQIEIIKHKFLELKINNLTEFEALSKELLAVEMEIGGSANTHESLKSRLEIVNSTNEESHIRYKKIFDETDLKINDAHKTVKMYNTIMLFSSLLSIFAIISISVATIVSITLFTCNYIHIKPEPIYSLVLISDSNISNELPESQKINIVLINDQYIYGYISSENSNKKPIVINKDLIRQLTRD